MSSVSYLEGHTAVAIPVVVPTLRVLSHVQPTYPVIQMMPPASIRRRNTRRHKKYGQRNLVDCKNILENHVSV